jgi:hypothetical protein
MSPREQVSTANSIVAGAGRIDVSQIRYFLVAARASELHARRAGPKRSQVHFFQAAHSASKCALAGCTEALSGELHVLFGERTIVRIAQGGGMLLRGGHRIKATPIVLCCGFFSRSLHGICVARVARLRVRR